MLQRWGKSKTSDKCAKPIVKKHIEVTPKRAEQEQEMKHLMSSKGHDASKSYQRIKKFHEKENKMKFDMDTQIYYETITNLLQ